MLDSSTDLFLYGHTIYLMHLSVHCDQTSNPRRSVIGASLDGIDALIYLGRALPSHHADQADTSCVQSNRPSLDHSSAMRLKHIVDRFRVCAGCWPSKLYCESKTVSAAVVGRLRTHFGRSKMGSSATQRTSRVVPSAHLCGSAHIGFEASESLAWVSAHVTLVE